MTVVAITAVVLGAGTVGYHCLEALSRSALARLVKQVTICDHAAIRRQNVSPIP
jgi:tRNA A37 threonylcarbamoyladenosine dehydratase